MKNLMINFSLLLLITSCMEGLDSLKRNNSLGRYSWSSVNVGYARILEDSPLILSGNPNLDASTDLGAYLTSKQEFITLDDYLIGSCTNYETCYQVLDKKYADPLTTENGIWGFEPNSDEFLEVHTFAHLKRTIDRYESFLLKSFNQAEATGTYNSAIPSNLYTSGANWFAGETLLTYSNCDISDNAYYSPSGFSFCYGYVKEAPSLKMAQDPSIIYHETGHALQHLMLNLRNTAAGLSTRSVLGHLYYDEAGSIGEGVSDYFSYVMNSRTHFAEWSLGRYLFASRPMSEDDPMHVSGLGTDSQSRLSYPTYLTYDPNFPYEIIEDIHVAGQIVSHYLVALTEDFKSTCSMSQTEAVDNILYLLTETYAELGDLTTKGYDTGPGSYVNLNANNAVEWLIKVNPISYPQFFQTFAKYLYLIFNQQPNCNGNAYSKDKIEQLLDDYGLLLFDTYNEDGNSPTSGHSGTHTAINSFNRLKTIVMPKDFVKIDNREGATRAYIFDKRSNIRKAVREMITSGQITGISSQIVDDLSHNNGNGLISPGEIVGVLPNILNDSNVEMAGVQILANDWDHTNTDSSDDDYGKPCTIEEFPNINNGGTTTGDCDLITSDNGDGTDKISSVCLVQSYGDNATLWVTQEKFMEEINFDSNRCLGDNSTHDCFVRAIPGADFAFYSKINPKRTWSETFEADEAEADNNDDSIYHFSNLLFFEINSKVPHGTIFQCRFRARFSNCSDCYSDSNNAYDNYTDDYFSSEIPFKLLYFQFQVVN